MGNSCGCAEDKDNAWESSGNLSGVKPHASPYKISYYQSRVTPTFFASYSSQDKDAMLAEAFNLLVGSVESHKILSNNLYVKQLTSKTVGKSTNSLGDTYDGEFINGLASGKGTIKSADGTQYEGQMFCGVKHGEGKVTESGPEARAYRTFFMANQPIGAASQQSVTRNENSGILHGGFDVKGQHSGPYLMEYHDKTFAYYIQKNDLPDGIHAFVTQDKNHVILSEYKADKEVGEPKTYALGQPKQAEQTQPQTKPTEAQAEVKVNANTAVPK